MRKFIGAILIWIFFVSLGFAQNAQEYYKNGYLYFSQGDYQKALEAYQKAIQVDPQFWDAYYWLGKVYEQLGNIPEAVTAWKTVLVAQPLHKDAFQKWRYYVRSVSVGESEKERWRDVFLYQNTAPAVGKEEAWSKIIPYALSLMGAKDVTSLRLAGAILRWAGQNVSALLVPYEKISYKRALEVLKETLPAEDPYQVYEFLRECLSRFEGDQEIVKLVNEALEKVFVEAAQTTQASGIEFRVYQDRVEKEALTFSEDSSSPRMEFYQKEHGAEGGS
jgi:tetratricopeptide (TPR) repeat protein